jgi:hypothetical protein
MVIQKVGNDGSWFYKVGSWLLRLTSSVDHIVYHHHSDSLPESTCRVFGNEDKKPVENLTYNSIQTI